ncbi:cyclin-Q-like isoform X2 [Stegodyphus dumicola]|nr:cyclin-Q-like isoform X2 [Stegodyphus dumicola]
METRTRALILFHHFITCAGETKYDTNLIAATALSLSSRINEQLIDMTDLINVFYSIANKTTDPLDVDDPVFLMLRRALMSADYLMMRMLEFNLTHRLAHQYLVPFFTILFERSTEIFEFRQPVSEICMQILSDFYMQKKCLNYRAEHIAIACINASVTSLGLLNEVVMTVPWYQNLCGDLTVEKVNEITEVIMQSYRTVKRNLPVTNSETSYDTFNQNITKFLYKISITFLNSHHFLMTTIKKQHKLFCFTCVDSPYFMTMIISKRILIMILFHIHTNTALMCGVCYYNH